MTVENIVFDIGNVFVRWAPLDNLKIIFPDHSPETLWEKMRPAWLELNRGQITLDEILDHYHSTLKLPRDNFRMFCDKIMSQATFLEDTLLLQTRLHEAGIPLYCISDNIREVIAYYYNTLTFMQRFKGAIISCDVNLLKPDARIYQCLLGQHDLKPESCVFFDDVQVNVDGAKQVGMAAFIFTDAATCERDLCALGLNY